MNLHTNLYMILFVDLYYVVVVVRLDVTLEYAIFVYALKKIIRLII